MARKQKCTLIYSKRHPKISHRKTPGHDGIHDIWFKKSNPIHDTLALDMNKCFQEVQVPDWLTKEKATLIQEDPSKGTAPNKYRPKTFLPMMWKILIAQITEGIYHSLTSLRVLPEE